MEIGPPKSVGSMPPELLVEMFKRAMAPDMARLEERKDYGDKRMLDVVAKTNENDSRFQMLEDNIERLAETHQGERALPEGAGADG